MQVLNVGFNSFEGTVAAELCSLHSLVELVLYNNNFDTLPSCLHQLRSLKVPTKTKIALPTLVATRIPQMLACYIFIEIGLLQRLGTGCHR